MFFANKLYRKTEKNQLFFTRKSLVNMPILAILQLADFLDKGVMIMKKGLLKVLAVSMIAANVTVLTASDAFAVNTVYTAEQGWTVTDAYVTAEMKKTITVQKIDKDDNPTITAYQIVKGTYVDNKLTDYVLCDDSLTLADKAQPTASEITNIAAAIRANTTTLNGIVMTRGNASEGATTVDYTADVEPGLYVVIVTDSSDGYVYNPAVVAVNVSDANDIAGAVGGSVDMTSYFNEDSTTFLKSNKVTVSKNIVDETNNTVAPGGSAAIGDMVKFRIDEMTIPSYSVEYTNPKYTVTDTLEGTAFRGITDLIVKIDGTAISPETGTYTLTCKDKDGNPVSTTATESKSSAVGAVTFTVDFVQDYIKSNAGKSVVIEYSTVISDTAGYNYSENQNTATIEYSNSPNTTSVVKDTTYHYTFGIGAKVDAEAGLDQEHEDAVQNTKTNEIVKVGESEGAYERVTDDEGYVVKRNLNALAGAEFTLSKNIDFTEVVGTSISDENGSISFTGLDAGIYYLKETAAPTTPVAYTVNNTIYRIEIIPTFDPITGVMDSYSIVTYKAKENGDRDGSAVGTATYHNVATIESDGSVTNTITVDESTQPLAIVNTKLAELPSTGGVGTIAITIAASLGMAGFLTIFIVNKKKNKNAD